MRVLAEPPPSAARSLRLPRPLRPVASAVWVPGVVLHVALGLFQLNRRDLINDEPFSLAATHHLSATLAQTHDTMAIYYLALTPWSHVSQSAAWISFPSLVATAIAVAFLGLLVERQVGPSTGRWAAIFAGGSFTIVRTSVDARSYGFWLMATAIAWYLLDRCLEDEHDRLRMLAFAGVILFLPLIHGMAALGIVGCAAAIAWARPPRRQAVRLLLPCALALAVTALLFVTGADRIGSPMDPISRTAIRTFFRGLVYPALKVAVFVIVLVAIGAWHLWRTGGQSRGATPLARFRQVALFTWGPVTAALLLAVSTVRPMEASKYAMPSALAIAALVAVAVVRPWSPRILRIAPFVVAAVVVLGQTEALVPVHSWRDSTATVDALAQPGDRIVFVPALARLPFEAALAGNDRPNVPRLAGTGQPLGTFDRFGSTDDLPATAAQAVTAPRIWVVGGAHIDGQCDAAEFLAYPAVHDRYRAVRTWQFEGQATLWLLERRRPPTRG